MSEKKVNIIIAIICVIALIAIAVIIYIANIKEDTPIDNTVAVSNINALNDELTTRMNNQEQEITVSLRKYEIDGAEVKVEVAVDQNTQAYELKHFIIGNNELDLNIDNSFMLISFGELQESNGNKLLYAKVTSGSQDGYGSLRIFTKEGDILYSNDRVYLEDSGVNSITFTEQYVELLMNVPCNTDRDEDVALKTFTYTSENKSLKLVSTSEKLIKDVCNNGIEE